MKIGIGLDPTLGLSFDEQKMLSQRAVHLGYSSIWTPEGRGQDSFQICALRWAASCAIKPEGITTGIAVSPVMYRTPIAFAMSAGTLSKITNDKFILGIGSGNAHFQKERHSLGMPDFSTLSIMRDYIRSTQALLQGELVNYEGSVVKLRGIKLDIKPPPKTPIYLGALGPEMLRLAGELADGAILNWCTPEQITWSKNCIAEGSKRIDRTADSIQVAQYIRICVDDDIDAARQALALAVLGYALGPRSSSGRKRKLGYRAHFERMGFKDVLEELDQMRIRGATREEMADKLPRNLLLKVGYYGPQKGAAKAFNKLAKGLDLAIVRVVATTQSNVNSVEATMEACAPSLLKATT